MKAVDRQILKDTAARLLRNRVAKKRTGLFPLDMLIVYVTMRCNAKCDHCFCWELLNVGIPEMTLEQFGRVAETTPDFRHLLLTGGEPTLRNDLEEIVGVFAARERAETVFINTNGLKPAKIVALAETIKAKHPRVGLDFQISIDGLGETHDRIRGVPGNFKKAVESLRAIHEMRKSIPALNAHALTVITEQNYTELAELNDTLKREVSPDLIHGFELVRDVEKTAWGIPQEIREKGVAPKNMGLPPLDAFPRIAADLKRINDAGPFRANAFHIHNLAQLEMVRTGREQYKCVTAGQAVGVLYSNADVAHCEFTLPFANLAKFDWDFSKLWLSDESNRRRAQIAGCWCIHGCFHGKAVEYSWRGLLEMARAAM